MFEVTPDDISKLTDSQLRELVGLLCEAECRSRHLPVSVVTYGGNQDAADGGLDVRVDLASDAAIDDFIPKAKTGFQVKKEDMPPSKILSEMRPQGSLRPSIQKLAEDDGAYVIVSSQGSTADTSLARRRATMRLAMNGAPKGENLFLDYYDRTRMASWVRCHPGLIIWVREKIGRSIRGWEPFGAWAYSADRIEAEYLLDDAVRISARPATSEGDFSIERGLDVIRGILRVPRSVVRLVGLSGVGKTRMVQALFDERVGARSLDPSLAIYTNINNSPDPQPVDLASNLVASGTRAILLVDNCAPELHARLSETVKQLSSRLSVITIEYDIRDDQPEGTDVFEIEASSVQLIEKLVQRRYPALSEIDTRTAANLSGGNARIALALAATVSKNGTFAGLSDEVIFERLFLQRHSEDRSLLEIAEVCSLVYSYNGVDTGDDANGELHRLGAMIGVTAKQVFRATVDLQDRDLVQQRGPWRALLPHALANRLAAKALRKIPRAEIDNSLFYNASERLIRSFSRRLGYLHASPEAQEIVRDWLKPDGWIGDVWNLNSFGKAVFSNILPVDPEAGLRAIEASIPEYDEVIKIISGSYLPRIVRSLAYDAPLFGRCEKLLRTFALHGEEKITKEAADVHAALFQLYLSGTHAPKELRLPIVKSLLASENHVERQLGISALKAMLKAWHFTSHFDFTFGARSRDYGLHPRSKAEATEWFVSVFSLISEVQGTLVQEDVNAVFAESFRGLWLRGGVKNHLEEAMLRIGRRKFWREGWVAVKQTRHFDAKDRSSDDFSILTTLEQSLRPNNLAERVRGCVFTKRGGSFDLYDEDEIEGETATEGRYQRKVRKIEALGEAVAGDEDVFCEILTEIVSGNGELFSFGRGLAQGAINPARLWEQMCTAFSEQPENGRNVQVFRGFLSALYDLDADQTDRILSEAVEAEPLAFWFPLLQAAVPIDPQGIERLMQSLRAGKSPAWVFGNLMLGRWSGPVPACDLAKLLIAISEMPEGFEPALNILYMHFHLDTDEKREHAPELIAVGQKLLLHTNFKRKTNRADHDLCGVARVCLVGDRGAEVAETLCQRLISAINAYETSAFDHSELLEGLFEAQPEIALNAFLTGDKQTISSGIGILHDASDHHPNPLSRVNNDALLAWCSREPGMRYAACAAVIPISFSEDEQQPIQWTPIARALLDAAPDPIAVMREFIVRFRPMSWSGSRAAMIEANAKLLDQIDITGKPDLARFIFEQQNELHQHVKSERESEMRDGRQRDESFE